VARIAYKVFDPEGNHIKTFYDRKELKAFLEGINWHIPSWHYDELYKYQSFVIHDDDNE